MEAEAVLLDVEREVLGDLVLVDDLAHAHADGVAARKAPPLDHAPDRRRASFSVASSRRLALVTAQLR